MKMNPHGRTRLITGQPRSEEEEPEEVEEREPPPPRYKPKPFKANLPLSHGKYLQSQIERWDREGKRRRSGG